MSRNLQITGAPDPRLCDRLSIRCVLPVSQSRRRDGEQARPHAETFAGLEHVEHQISPSAAGGEAQQYDFPGPRAHAVVSSIFLCQLVARTGSAGGSYRR